MSLFKYGFVKKGEMSTANLPGTCKDSSEDQLETQSQTESDSSLEQ